LGDNMGDMLAFERGRAHDLPLLTLVRRWAAVCMGRNLRPALRWIPSERNVADAPSRLQRLEGAAPYFVGEANLGPVERASGAPGHVDALVRRAMDPRVRRPRPVRLEAGLAEPDTLGPGPASTRAAPGLDRIVSSYQPTPGAGTLALPPRPAALEVAPTAAEAPEVPTVVAVALRRPPALAEPQAGRRALLPRQLRGSLRGVVARRSYGRVAPAVVGQYFADLYAGTGGVSRAVDDRGYRSRQWDPAWGVHPAARPH
jgi:hypothetical protein